MANPEHLAILKQGVEVWNRWREENPTILPNLQGARLPRLDLVKVNFRETNLGDTNLRESNLQKANLQGANLRGANLDRANLRGVNLNKAELLRARLVETNLTEADVTRANLRGINFRKTNLTRAELYEADLDKAHLQGTNFCGANLQKANLHRANLSRAYLYGANLREANLAKTCLHETHFSEVKLIEAELNEADLRKAIFTKADLTKTALTNAVFFETILGDTNLRLAEGLETCHHLGPSTIDHRTLVKSGRLPQEFLRGCGLPDSMIEYLPSFLNEPIQLYSVFISYSHRDEAFAKRLYDALQGKGVRCWYAPEDIQGGKKTHEQINDAIRIHDKLLLVLSEHSMSSHWVKTEIRRARKAEITEKRRKFFPIRLISVDEIHEWEFFNADVGEDLDAEIREYFIPDFSNWKDHDAFEQSFTRLLRDLRADDNHGNE